VTRGIASDAEIILEETHEYSYTVIRVLKNIFKGPNYYIILK
jgi:hypothetical protein